MEEWKTIIGYENYEVSNTGKIKNKKSGKILKPIIMKNGYARVSLKQKVCLIHRLVLQTFLPTEDKRLEVNHKNHNRTDNFLENLEWVTHFENMHLLKIKPVLKPKCIVTLYIERKKLLFA